MMRRPIAYVLLVLTLMMAAVWLMQRRLIYFPDRSLPPAASAVFPGAQDVTVALGNETCIGINQPATFIGGQPLQLPVAQCLYVPSVRKDISIDPDTGRVRLGWTSGTARPWSTSFPTPARRW